jgi:hypothetical protein
MRQEEFNEWFNAFFDQFRLMDLDKVSGLKPLKKAPQGWTARSERPVEMQDPPMMPMAASLSARNSFHRL